MDGFTEAKHDEPVLKGSDLIYYNMLREFTKDDWSQSDIQQLDLESNDGLESKLSASTSSQVSTISTMTKSQEAEHLF
jgi:hypothetical protein